MSLVVPHYITAMLLLPESRLLRREGKFMWLICSYVCAVHTDGIIRKSVPPLSLLTFGIHTAKNRHHTAIFIIHFRSLPLGYLTLAMSDCPTTWYGSTRLRLGVSCPHSPRFVPTNVDAAGSNPLPPVVVRYGPWVVSLPWARTHWTNYANRE